jgi:hypothetical protein
MACSQDYPHDRYPEFKIHTAASARNITGPSGISIIKAYRLPTWPMMSGEAIFKESRTQHR